jgi:hypothetical protein
LEKKHSMCHWIKCPNYFEEWWCKYIPKLDKLGDHCHSSLSHIASWIAYFVIPQNLLYFVWMWAPWWVTNTLDAFRSPWKISLSCKYAMPIVIWEMMFNCYMLWECWILAFFLISWHKSSSKRGITIMLLWSSTQKPTSSTISRCLSFESSTTSFCNTWILIDLTILTTSLHLSQDASHTAHRCLLQLVSQP